MREIRSSKELLLKQLKLSEEFLSDAQELMLTGRLRSAIDRAYYAMFHAAQAVLFMKGRKPKTHVGVIRMFGKEIIEGGVLDRKYGRFLNEAYDARHRSTYEITAEL